VTPVILQAASLLVSLGILKVAVKILQEGRGRG
jgi:hypothetical protein